MGNIESRRTKICEKNSARDHQQLRQWNRSYLTGTEYRQTTLHIKAAKITLAAHAQCIGEANEVPFANCFVLPVNATELYLVTE